jgi:glycine/D-amino acid oxidase-like deaminating enzyme
MTVATPPDLGRSWWLREALADEAFAGPPAPRLDTDATADVLILGGGYTGMWTAWFLKERDPSIDVVILEADICGGGPSGRNGGFCDGWWSGIADLIATYGEDAAKDLLVACGASPGEIGAWCEANGVDAWFRMGGDLAVASAPAHDGRWLGTIRAARRLGFEDGYHVLSAAEVRDRVDSPVFGAGMLIDDGANVQPARLARGLRRVLLERGVRIHEQTPVRRFGAGRPAAAETPFGTVSAEHAVIALGAWATPWKAFRSRLTVRGSYMAITEPAPERLAEIGWTGGESVRDFRSSVHYIRTTPDGRIAMGLGGIQPDLARRIDPRYAYDAGAVRRVAEDIVRFFPAFGDVGFAAGWGGPINVAGLSMPFFGTLPSGNVHYGLGYTGNGVGPSHLGGKILAALTLGADDPLTRLAVVTRDPKRFPPEPIRSPGMFVANKAIFAKDDREARGMVPGWATRFVATLPRRLGFNLGPR